MRRKGFAAGYIPNFAETPDTATANTTSAITAIGIELTTLALLLKSNSGSYKESLQELTKSNVDAIKSETKRRKEAITSRSFVSNTKGGRDFSNYSGGKTGKEFGDLRRASRTPLSQERRDQAARDLRAVRAESRGQQAKAEKGSLFQRGKAFAKGGRLSGLGFAAPILAQTATQFIPQNTKEGRVQSAAVGGVGQIASFAATGAMFGPIGAAVGAAAGALLTIPDIVSQATTNFPELQANAEKASQELTKFSEAGARIQTAYESLQTSLANPNASQDAISKASEAYSQHYLNYL